MAIANITLARPYAKAAFAYALKANQVKEWLSFLTHATFVVQDPEVQLFLQNPRYHRESHQALLRDILKKYGNESQLNFLDTLAENRRLTLLPQITQLFEQLLAEQENTLNVEVLSKYALTDEQQKILIQKLEKRWSRKVNLTLKEDQSLLGGLIIKAGDRIIDGTLQNQLNLLQQELVS